MINKKLSLFLIMSLFASGCAMESRENFDANMNSYKGQSVDTLVKNWGPPNAGYQNQDGTKVYQWVQGGSSTHFAGASYPWIGGQSHAYGPWNNTLWPAWHGGLYNSGIGMIVSRPMALDRSCTLNVTADKNGNIAGYTAIGDGCVAE